MNKNMSLLTIFLILIAVFLTRYYPIKNAYFFTHIREYLNPFLEWYYVLLVAFLLFFMLWLGMKV